MVTQDRDSGPMEKLKIFNVTSTTQSLRGAALSSDMDERWHRVFHTMARDITTRATRQPLSIYVCSNDRDRDVRNFFCFVLAKSIAAGFPDTRVVDCDFLSTGLTEFVPDKDKLGLLDLMFYGSSLESITQEAGNGVRVIGAGSFPVARRSPFVAEAFYESSRYLARRTTCVIFCGPAQDDAGRVHPIVSWVDLPIIVQAGRPDQPGMFEHMESDTASARESLVWSLRFLQPGTYSGAEPTKKSEEKKPVRRTGWGSPKRVRHVKRDVKTLYGPVRRKPTGPEAADVKPAVPAWEDRKPASPRAADQKPAAPETAERKPAAPETADLKRAAPETAERKPAAPRQAGKEVTVSDTTDRKPAVRKVPDRPAGVAETTDRKAAPEVGVPAAFLEGDISGRLLTDRTSSSAFPKVLTSILGVFLVGFLLWWLYLTKSVRDGLQEPVNVQQSAMDRAPGLLVSGETTATQERVVATSDRDSVLRVATLATDGRKEKGPGRDEVRTEPPVVQQPEPEEPTATISTGVSSKLERHAGRYLIHVSSFRGMERATKDATYLEGRGYSVVVAPVDLGDKGMWYRVYVGPFDTEDEASKLKITLDENPRVRSTRITRVER